MQPLTGQLRNRLGLSLMRNKYGQSLAVDNPLMFTRNEIHPFVSTDNRLSANRSWIEMKVLNFMCKDETTSILYFSCYEPLVTESLSI